MSRSSESDTNLQARNADYYRRVLQDLLDMRADLTRLANQQAGLPAEAIQPASYPTLEEWLDDEFDLDDEDDLDDELDIDDEPDSEVDINSRPVAEIIQEICRDLGIDRLPPAHPWRRRTPAEISAITARAARNLFPEARDSSTTNVIPFRPWQPTFPRKNNDPP